MAELPHGVILRKTQAGYGASYTGGLMALKNLKCLLFEYDNPADALAYLFVHMKKEMGENINYAKDVVIKFDRITRDMVRTYLENRDAE